MRLVRVVVQSESRRRGEEEGLQPHVGWDHPVIGATPATGAAPQLPDGALAAPAENYGQNLQDASAEAVSCEDQRHLRPMGAGEGGRGGRGPFGASLRSAVRRARAVARLGELLQLREGLLQLRCGLLVQSPGPVQDAAVRHATCKGDRVPNQIDHGIGQRTCASDGEDHLQPVGVDRDDVSRAQRVLRLLCVAQLPSDKTREWNLRPSLGGRGKTQQLLLFFGVGSYRPSAVTQGVPGEALAHRRAPVHALDQSIPTPLRGDVAVVDREEHQVQRHMSVPRHLADVARLAFNRDIPEVPVALDDAPHDLLLGTGERQVVQFLYDGAPGVLERILNRGFQHLRVVIHSLGEQIPRERVQQLRRVPGG
mmetsp:Transcript_50727/g.146276  ORF Transcript_50727/g.146276 Transcript_50727/m.146276 type:complete len:367 (+) Transcript_50727:1379-2479(+)